MQNPNKEHSSVKQALLDLKASGGDAECIDFLINQIGTNPEIRGNADKLFKSHLYPDKTLNWFKLHNDIEFTRFLSPNALMILIAMCQNMRHGNLIQVNYKDLLTITHISSPKAIKPALQELENCGCITVRIKGTTRRSTVYMVNPEIATVGTNSSGLAYIYWKYVSENNAGSHSYQMQNNSTIWNDYPASPILDKWIQLVQDRTYSKGNDTLEEDSNKVYFNKINEPKIKTESEKDIYWENSKNTHISKNTSKSETVPEQEPLNEDEDDLPY